MAEQRRITIGVKACETLFDILQVAFLKYARSIERAL
jgi:hypothetical protein